MNYITFLRNAAKATDGVAAAASAAESGDARKKLEEILAGFTGGSVEKPELPLAEYERMTYDAPTDDMLKAAAESTLAEYKTANIDNIDKKATENAAAKTAEIARENAAAAAKAEKINAEYAAAVTDFENDALKRGMARSSVAVNNSAALRNAAAAQVAAAAALAGDNIKQLEAEIGQLEVSRKAALDSFNIAYAAKLSEKINELTAARDAKAAEVVKYNNALAEKEYAATLEKAQLESKLYTDALNQKAKADDIAGSVSSTTYRARYDAIVDYLSTLSAADAKRAVLTDSLIRDSCNDYYYYHLYNDFVAGK